MRKGGGRNGRMDERRGEGRGRQGRAGEKE